jgi:putative flippase GtrA
MKDFVKQLFRIQFVKFCIVGGLGLITDMVVFSLIKNIFEVESRIILNIIPLFGYIAAVSQNYLINHFWTFGEEMYGKKVSTKGYTGFFIVSLFALLPRYLVFNSILGHYGTSGLYPHLANFVGILVGTVFNFLGSKFFVFKRDRK